MGNLLGQPFKDWVTTQINTRQKSLGKYSNISSQDLQYYSNKTPFLRLASSVNLTNEGPEQKGKKTTLENSVLKKLIASGIPEDLITGDALAKNFILQAGAVSSKEEKGLQLDQINAGLNSPDNLFSGAYGWGGIDERGYVPLPGITQADVQYNNNGALTSTTINIRCYSKAQFQLVDVLYLRPGYTLLLEFGWSQYLTNMDDEGNYSLESFNEFNTEPLSILLNPDAGGRKRNQYDIYKAIEKTRKAHDGNYEAVYGKISNFSWQFNPDGSYDCRVRLTGMGDVIESLKMNIADPKKETDDVTTTEDAPSTPPAEKEVPPLVANADKTVLNKNLFFVYQQYTKNPDRKFINFTIKNFQDTSGKSETVQINKAAYGIKGTTLDEGLDNASPQVYITFGFLLALIQSRLLLYDNKTKTPITTFDVNFKDLDKDDNFILKLPGEFSANPKVCLIPYENSTKPEGGLTFPQTDLNEDLENGAKWNAGVYAGRLTSIYLNVNYIATVLQDANTDDDGAVSLLTFLQTIIKGMTEALGGFNKIVVKLGEEGNIKFIEEIPQRTDDFLPKPQESTFARFNVFGVKPGVEGSFVRNVNLQAEISNNFSTMIAIGAQSNGNQISGNATSFSNYNAGLKDRVIEEKKSYYPKKQTEDSEQDQETSIKDNWNNNINSSENSLLVNIYANLQFLDENITSLTSHNLTHAKLILGELSKKTSDQQLNAPFFLPFNFSLEIDGLSGMRLYEKFLMTDDILPPSYENDGVDLQIKGLNHSITQEAWITKIDTQSVPAEKLGAPKRPPKLSSKVTGQTGTSSGGSGTALPPPPPQNLPQDEKLRLKTYRIMDDGTQTLGYYEVLDESGSVLYNLAVSELPWKGNQNSISCIPTGNYRVKSHTSGKHGNCFWYIGNEAGNYAFDKLFGNGYIRTAVLIHKSPKAPGWLQGCQGPGFKFNTKSNQKGRQQGTGDNYLDPAKSQSQQAVDKLLGTLYSEGSFRATIENVFDPLPTSFDDPRVQQIIKEKQLI